MIIHTDRIVLVFPIAEKNRPAAASLQTLTVYDDGAERETVVPLDPALVADYAEAFSLPLIAERDELQAQLTAMTAERDAALAEVESVTATMRAEIDRLTALIPAPSEAYQVTRSEFIARLQAADPTIIVDIWKSQSSESILAAVAMFTHDGVIDMRPNQRMHQMLQSLIPLGIITTEQVNSILIEG